MQRLDSTKVALVEGRDAGGLKAGGEGYQGGVGEAELEIRIAVSDFGGLQIQFLPPFNPEGACAYLAVEFAHGSGCTTLQHVINLSKNKRRSRKPLLCPPVELDRLAVPRIRLMQERHYKGGVEDDQSSPKPSR